MNFHNFNNDDELSEFGFSLNPFGSEPQSGAEYGFRRAPRGMLLAGVPGCGKSLGARALGQEKTILTVNPADLRKGYVGKSEEKIARLLDLAESMDAILAIDTPGELKKQYLNDSQFKLHAENIQNTFRKRLQNDVTKETRRKSWKQTIIRNIHHVTQLVFELIQYLREKGYG